MTILLPTTTALPSPLGGTLINGIRRAGHDFDPAELAAVLRDPTQLGAELMTVLEQQVLPMLSADPDLAHDGSLQPASPRCQARARRIAASGWRSPDSIMAR